MNNSINCDLEFLKMHLQIILGITVKKEHNEQIYLDKIYHLNMALSKIDEMVRNLAEIEHRSFICDYMANGHKKLVKDESKKTQFTEADINYLYKIIKERLEICEWRDRDM